MGRFHISGTGPAYVYASIGIGGAQPLRVTSIERTAVVVDASWAPFPESDRVAVFGARTRWHPFPATLPAGRLVQIRLQIHRPADCPATADPDGATMYFDGEFQLHWTSPSGYHRVLIDRRSTSYSVELC